MLLGAFLRRAPVLPAGRQTTTALRSIAFRPALRSHLRTPSFRFKTIPAGNARPASESAAPKYAYGQRICVYHAGTGRTTFLAVLKLSTVFIFVFFGFVVTPAYYEKEGLSVTVARTAFCAVVPLAFVAWTTSPFVTFIHMRLPPYARASEEALRRYIKSLPPQTELDITIMSLIAKPRMSTVQLGDLRAANKRIGNVNMVRDTTAENARRKWYMYPAVGKFYTQDLSGLAKLPWIWPSIRSRIIAQK
ncbi:hypothetical protein GGR57DRAFT_332678 [Xylariaceae sp. FL1272]|nr:hypothetical protein GGR57DRAFT_332678 [Xylariaceae sp. FL1272]